MLEAALEKMLSRDGSASVKDLGLLRESHVLAGL